MVQIRYSKDHEYVRVEGDIGVVGITAYAQEQLGDIVFVELPETGRTVSQGDEAAVVESVKAASEVYAPISGEVVAVNDAIEDDPALVNQDPEGAAWFLKLKIADAAELDTLMDAEAYARYVETVS